MNIEAEENVKQRSTGCCDVNTAVELEVPGERKALKFENDKEDETNSEANVSFKIRC